MLKACLAGERTQFSHITEVLEATTGSAEEVTIGYTQSFRILRFFPAIFALRTIWLYVGFPPAPSRMWGLGGIAPSLELSPLASIVSKALGTFSSSSLATLGERSKSIETFVQELQEHQELLLPLMLSRRPPKVSIVLK